jgi:transposase InsO family protein
MRQGLKGALDREIPDFAGTIGHAARWKREEEDIAMAHACGGASSSKIATVDANTLKMRAVVHSLLTQSQRVYAFLLDSIPSELRTQIAHLTQGNGFALWRWLEVKFQSTEADAVGGLWRQWSSLRMETDESFDAYRARVNSAKSLLEYAKEKISDSHYCFVLLDNLQPRYAQAVLALKAGGITKDASKIDWEAVTALLNSHEKSEQRHTENMGGGEQQQAMAATRGHTAGAGRGGSRNETREQRAERYAKTQCFYCKQFGHYKMQCPKNPEAQGNGHQQKNSFASSAADGSSFQRRSQGSNEQVAAAIGAGHVTRNQGSAPEEYDFLYSAMIMPEDEMAAEQSRAATYSEVVMATGGSMGVQAAKLKRLVRPNEVRGLAPKAAEPSAAIVNQKKEDSASRVAAAAASSPVVGQAQPRPVREEAPMRSRAAEAAARAVPEPRFVKQSLDAALASSAWGVDSMASCHISGNKEQVTGLRRVAPVRIKVADGAFVECDRIGRANIRVMGSKNGDKKLVKIEINDVYYHERFAANLLSWNMLRLLGWEMHSTEKESFVVTKGKHKVQLNTRGRVSVLEAAEPERVYGALAPVELSTAEDLVLLHERLGHMGVDAMISALKSEATEDLGTLKMDNATLAQARKRLMACTACTSGKGARATFKHGGIDHGTRPGEVVHMDTFVLTLGKDIPNEYGLTMSDPFSNWRAFAHAKSKDQIVGHIIAAVRTLEGQLGQPVKRLYSDGGSEFVNATLKNFCSANGKELLYPPARTPELNGIAERSVRTLKEGARTLLMACGLPGADFWSHAMKHFIYVWNRVRTGRTGITPFEALRKTKPSVRHLSVFGCDVFCHIPHRDSTFSPKMEPGIYLGHDTVQNCPIVYLLQGRSVVRSRDVRFRPTMLHARALRTGPEEVNRLCQQQQSHSAENSEPEAAAIETADGSVFEWKCTSPPQGGMSAAAPGDTNPDAENDKEKQYEVENIIGKRGFGKSTRYLIKWVGYPESSNSWEELSSLTNAQDIVEEYERNNRVRTRREDQSHVVHMAYSALGGELIRSELPDVKIIEQLTSAMELAYAAQMKDDKTPETYRDAVNSPDAAVWRAAMEKEIASCVRMGTWIKMPRSELPKDINVLSCKWVFKLKTNQDGVVTEAKARLTPRGFEQKEGKDYFEVFARTGMYKTKRIGLALSAMWGHNIDQMDVPSAFLFAPVDEDIYIRLPEGFEEPGMVLKLLKALYGLKQAPRNWYLMISKFMREVLKFTPCVSDPCLFWKRSRTLRLILIFMFVDDFQISYHPADTEEWKQAKAQLILRFNTKDMGESKWILGMRIQRDRAKGTLTLDQEQYITKALERFGLTARKNVETPEACNADRGAERPGDSSAADHARFMELVGTLLYAVISTRPDAAHAVQRLTRHMQAPLQIHMREAERVLRYLGETKHMGLTFGQGGQKDPAAEIEVSAYADADWANDKTDRKSITGWITRINGDVVSWASKKQRTVAQSTCEAELYAEAAAINEVLWLRGLLEELGLTVGKPSRVYGDNQSTIAVSKNGVKSERTKHVDIKFNFVTETVESGVIQLDWVQSSEQQADIFTKGLARPLFEKMREAIMPATEKQN